MVNVIIQKQWKKMLALLLIITMTSTYLLTDFKVAQAENTSVTFTLANSNEQDGEGRYLIVLNVQGMSVPNAATGWDNTVYLDGVEKTGVEGSGLAYSYCGSESQMYLLLQYDFVESGARTASSIGKHEIVIPEGTRISFGSVTMELTKDFAIYINGSTVFSSAITHTYSSVTGTKKGDNGNFLRFKVTDSLETQGSALVILDGGLYKNGVLIAKDAYDIQKPWADAYHIGLDKGKLTFDVGDRLRMDVLVVSATDTTYSYAIKFEITFECTSTTDAGSTSATWSWSAVEPEPELPQPAITHTYSSVTGTKKGDNGNFLRFAVEDTLGAQTSALVILDGGLYKNGVLIAEDAYDIQKPWADAYHIGLDKGKLTFDVGDELTMDVLAVVATDTTYSYPIKFEITFECTSTTDAGSTSATWSWSVVEPEPELPQPAITHIYSSVTSTKKGDNGNFLRFAVEDTLGAQTSALVILDGGLYKNGVLIAEDAYDIQKPWADAYHIGLDKGKLTFDIGDELTMDVLAVAATDITYSYPIKFEITFECTSTTDAGSTSATWSWSAVEPEPELPQPAITHVYSSVTSTKKGDNGNYLRFAVEDTLGAQGSALVILDGGLYKNGVLIAEDAYDIQKPWADAYHIGLDKGKLTFDVGDRLTMDVLVVAATDTTYSYPIKFEITFECTSTTDAGSTSATWSWSAINEDNDMTFIKLDTKETTQRDDGVWLIYLYTNRSILGVDDEVATITVQVGDVIYSNEVPMYRQSDSQRMLIALNSEQLNVDENGAVAITIPYQPNVTLQSSGNVINIAKEFTFYLYSNGSFGLLGDADGTSAGNVNGDDVIGSQDLICLKKYFADHADVNHTEHTLKSGGADANENGYIEETDIIKLYEYILEGWTVDGMSYEAGTQLPVYLDDEDIQLAAYQGPRTLTSDGTDDLTSIEEEFQRYKEAGFNTIIHEADCAYSSQLGSDMWYKLKQYMRMAQKYDLDVLISSQELNDYLLNGNEGNGTEDSANWQYSIDRLIAFMKGTENNIVSGSTYGNDTEVVVFDNFAGFVMADEPDNDSAIMARYKTAKAYLDEQYSSAFGGRKPVLFYSLESYEAEAFTTIDGFYLLGTWFTSKKVETAYGTHSTFLANYGNITGSATIDRYPFRVDDMDGKLSPQDPDDGGGANYLDAGWLYQLELLATQGKANGFATGITLQSSAFTHSSDARRKINSVADVKFEVYSALAYGMHSVNYFTYNLPANPPEGETYTCAMANDTTTYNAVQTVNNEISKFDYVFNDYDWVSTKYYGTSSDGLFDKLTSNISLPNITSVNASNAAIVSHMKDYEKYLDGYWVVNTTDPEDNLSNEVTVTFDTAYTKAIAFVDGEKKIVNLTNGVYEAQLEAGEGVFIIPLKIAE